jgi:REP element-mobilizing transposase RayT
LALLRSTAASPSLLKLITPPKVRLDFFNPFYVRCSPYSLPNHFASLKPMAQSLARLNVHLIFSTKNRLPLLRDPIRDALHCYFAIVLKNLSCPPILINSVTDHVHLLFGLARTIPIAVAVEEIKKTSSKWLKTHGLEYADFSWQAGYGAFSVSESNVSAVKDISPSNKSTIKRNPSTMNTWAF